MKAYLNIKIILFAVTVTVSNALTARTPYSFQPRPTHEYLFSGFQSYLKSSQICFKWTPSIKKDGSCHEMKVDLCDSCDKTPRVTFYVDCDVNVNSNVYVQHWTLRVWDYLYTNEGNAYYFMKPDGSCLQKKIFRWLSDGVEMKDFELKKEKCDKVKEGVDEEAGPLDKKIVEKTWHYPEPENAPRNPKTLGFARRQILRFCKYLEH